MVQTFEYAMQGPKVLVRKDTGDMGTQTGVNAPALVIEAFDGARYVGVFPQGNTEVPAIVNVEARAAAKEEQYELAVVLGLFLDNKPFHEVLGDGSATVESTSAVAGHRCCVLVVRRPYGAQKLFLAEKLGFMPVRIEEHDSAGELVQLSELQDWTQADGVPLPSTVKRQKLTRVKDYGEKLPEATELIRCDSITVNGQLPDVLFTVDLDGLPKGSEVIETDTGRTYFAGIWASEQDVVSAARHAKAYLRGEIELAELQRRIGKGMNYSRMCGPYALLMLCALLGTDATLDELAKLANTDERGITTLDGLASAARAKKLHAVGLELSLEELAQLGKPAIVHLKAGAGHFALFLRYVPGGIVLMDPPTRLVMMSQDEFLEKWDRVALVVKDE